MDIQQIRLQRPTKNQRNIGDIDLRDGKRAEQRANRTAKIAEAKPAPA